MLIKTGPFAGLQQNGYRVILLDPSWAYATRSAKGDGRSANRHYKTMKLAEMKTLPVADLAAKNCVMFMWVIDTHLPQALDLIRHWDFTFKTVGFYWSKTNRDGTDFMGMGFWTRAGTEQVWTAVFDPLTDPEPDFTDPLVEALQMPHQAFLATRGAPKRVSKNVRRLIQSPRREHSRKPEDIHERIEALVDGPYLELFARKSRPGWDTWGNEKTKFDINTRLESLLDDRPRRRTVEDMLL